MKLKQSEEFIIELERVIDFQDRRAFAPVKFEGRTVEYVREELAGLLMNIVSQKDVEKIKISDNYDHWDNLIDAMKGVISLATAYKEDGFQIEQSELDLVEEEINALFTALYKTDLKTDDLISTEYLDQIHNFFHIFKESFNMISLGLYNNVMNWIKKSVDIILLAKTEYDKNIGRTQYEIAYWVIVSNFVTYNDQQQEIYSRLVAMGLQINEFYRLQNKETEDLWQKLNDELPTTLVRNLVKDRALLDDLFFWQDSCAENSDYPVDDTLDIKWDEVAGRREQKNIETRSYEVYIEEYISSHWDKIYLPEKHTIDKLKYELEKFMWKNPIESMRNSEGILKAFEHWKEVEGEHIAEPNMAKVYFTWIKNFIMYLSEKNIVGKLPVLKDYMFSYGKNILDLFDNYRKYDIIVRWEREKNTIQTVQNRFLNGFMGLNPTLLKKCWRYSKKNITGCINPEVALQN